MKTAKHENKHQNAIIKENYTFFAKFDSWINEGHYSKMLAVNHLHLSSRRKLQFSLDQKIANVFKWKS